MPSARGVAAKTGQSAERRHQRAAVRAPARRVNDGQSGYLRKNRVGPQSQHNYAVAVQEFEAWANLLGWRRGDLQELDTALDAYFDEQYWAGELVWVGRQTLYGLYWQRSLNRKDPSVLPLSRAALQGWERKDPGGSRDPVPWVAVCLIAVHLIELNTSEAILAASAFVLAFDMYLRPGETLRITRGHVQPPARCKGYQKWAVVFFPRDEGVTSKNRAFDYTVIAGTPEADRGWVAQLLAALFCRTSVAEDLLFEGLTAPRYRQLIRDAAVATNTHKCNVSPHSARHGGPSEDHFKNARSLPCIQERGRWSAAESVDRYRKAGALLRMIAKLSPAVQASGERAAKSLSTKLIAAVSSMKR